MTGRHARWHEILAYREKHALLDWRALDDSAFEFPRNCAELILCNGAIGMEEAQVRLIREWLGR